MSVDIFLFWFSLFFIFYAYLGYPCALSVISLFYRSDRKHRRLLKTKEQFSPRVSLFISAYNEESVIEKKIKNSLSFTYPHDLIEIVVISDGSTDGTNEIVSRYSDKGIVLRHYDGRIGKTACLNRAIPLAKGDIIVFSDANSQYDSEAIEELVKHFADDTIGYVTGWTRYVSHDDDGGLHPIGIYSRLETFTKRLESKITSCVGADGAIFAIRKGLYEMLREQDINDFVLPLNIIRQGYRGIIEKNAFCVENAVKEIKGEFHRQVRITTRTIRAIINNVRLLNPLRYGLFSFALLSHKICKFAVPFFLCIFFFSGLFLSVNSVFYLLISAGQVFFYVSALVDAKDLRVKYISRLLAASRTFITVNIAIVSGWIKYFQGETYTTWSPTRR